MRKFDIATLMHRTLKVVVPKIDPPHINSLNYSIYRPGIVWQILREMAMNLSLTFEVESMERDGWGVKEPGGKWNGAIGKLAREDAEIVAGGTILNSDRFKVVDFTIPIDFQESAVLIRVPDRHNFVAEIFLNAFNWELWLALFVLLLLFIAAFTLLNKNANGFSNGIFSCFIMPFSPFARRGKSFQNQCQKRRRHFSSLTMLFTFLFATFIIMANFCAHLVFSFSNETMKFPFETWDEIIDAIKDGQWTLVLDIKSPGRTQQMLESDPLVLKLFKDSERVKFVDGVVSGTRFVQNHTGKAMLIAPNSRLRGLAKMMCDVMVLPKTVLPAYVGIALRKGSPYRHFLNQRIRMYWHSGQIQRWTRNFDFHATVRNRVNYSKCDESNDNRLTNGIIGFEHLADIFLFLSFGLLFSFAVFLLELAIHWSQFIVSMYLTEKSPKNIVKNKNEF